MKLIMYFKKEWNGSSAISLDIKGMRFLGTVYQIIGSNDEFLVIPANIVKCFEV